ncbi:MAG: hypothetical protein AABO41_02905 [Acidobacteriota bacterium]
MEDVLGKMQQDSYAARDDMNRKISEERFKQFCADVKGAGDEGDRVHQFLIRLRAELGFHNPQITLPDTPTGSAREAELDEIYRLMVEHRETPFDIEGAINNDLLWGHKPGYTYHRE